MDKRKLIFTSLFTIIGVLTVVLIMLFVFDNNDVYKEAEPNIDGEDEVKIEEQVGTEINKEDEVVDEELDTDNIDPEEEVIVEEEVPKGVDIRTFLLLGIDRTEERDENFTVYRSDSIALVRLDINDNWVKILSIPRDTYTYLPITDRKDKINHAYAFGGLNGRAEASVIDAVNLLVDDATTRKFFALEMEPVPEIIDYFGGVEIDVEIDIQTHGADISKGLQVLDGKDAYDYVHWRYSANGDIDRISRQQKFAKALLNQLSNNYTYNELNRVLIEHSDHFNTNIHVSEIEDILKVMVRVDEIEFSSVEGYFLNLDGISYWGINEEKLKETLSAFFSNPIIEENVEE